jgi:hypothetical protein
MHPDVPLSYPKDLLKSLTVSDRTLKDIVHQSTRYQQSVFSANASVDLGDALARS